MNVANSTVKNANRVQFRVSHSRYRASDPRDSDLERRAEYHKEDRRVSEKAYREERRERVRRHGSSDRESDHRSPRPSDVESERNTRSRNNGPLDSPALVSIDLPLFFGRN